jgi:hypothetical protein
LGSEIAIDDYKRRLEIAAQQGNPIKIPPIAAFVAYHVKLIEVLLYSDLDL